MNTYIALFRGINVGGNNVLPMKELVSMLENIGLVNVRTYIQSGNAIFQCKTEDRPALVRAIGAAIKASRGFEPQVLLLALDELKQAIDLNPFSKAVPNTLHLNFLAAVPEHPDLATLEHIKLASERFELIGNVFYLHAPDGIGRSKLAANTEKLLGVTATSRNWQTACRIMQMANADPAAAGRQSVSKQKQP